MSKGTLQALGTGDGWAGEDRGHSAFLYRLEGGTLLVDCGEPVSRRLRAAGVAPDELDAILLSHLHCDHVGGFFMLMQGFWLDKRTRDLPVHLPAEGAFETGQIKITPHPTSHLDQLREHFSAKYPAAFEAFSFVLETPYATIAHSADIGAVEDLEPLLQKPVDLLLCELAHVKPPELFEYLAQKEISQVAFTHISRPYREDLAATQSAATTALGGMRHVFLSDGEVLEV